MLFFGILGGRVVVLRVGVKERRCKSGFLFFVLCYRSFYEVMVNHMPLDYDHMAVFEKPVVHSPDLAVLVERLASNPPVQGDIKAAVLVVITNELCPKVLLTKRSASLSSHAGEVSFVGGRRDEGDESSVHTALREAYEEVGLSCKAVSVVGYLPMQVSARGVSVRPVVALVEPCVANGLVPSEFEIERLFWGSLHAFFKEPACHTIWYGDRHIKTPAWYIKNETVWGLTGRVMASLMERCFDRRYVWYYEDADLPTQKAARLGSVLGD